MMRGKIPKITGLIFVTTMMGIALESDIFLCDSLKPDVNFSDNRFSHDRVPGIQPVSDVPQNVKNEWGLPTSKSIAARDENLNYRKWCEETFMNGSDIYKAYKEVAFNITYTPEQEKTDFWQTPSETKRIKKGDCEDAVLLFFSQIPPEQKCAEIVWGWVFDKKSMVGKAHVWYQIQDRKGRPYVVEAFSQTWNGIMPLDVLERNEIRKPIFAIAHDTVARLVNSLQKAAYYQKKRSEMDLFAETSSKREETTVPRFSQEWATLFSLTDNNLFDRVLNMQYTSRVSTRPQRFFHKRNLKLNMREISNILTKLHEVLSRYVNQKSAIGTQVRSGTYRDEARHSSLTKNFICRR